MDAPKGKFSRWKMDLGNESRGSLKVFNDLSNLPSVNTCPRHKENQVYNEIYQFDKKFEIYIPNRRCY